jgi:transglutaminase-like putative cysteine protease
VRFILAVLAFSAIVFGYGGRFTGLEAGTALLSVMLVLKLLETARQRDYVLLSLFACFLPLAAFLRHDSLWLLPYFALALLSLTVAMLQAGREGAPLAPRQALGLSARMLSQALPLALVLLVLFPRVPGALWSLPAPGEIARSGLSDELRPGDISRLVLSDEIAFRVRFEDRAPGSSQMYWRGPVLERFDGRTWRESRYFVSAAGRVAPQFEGAGMRYELTLEPHGRDWVFALEMPTQWPRNVSQTRQLNLRDTGGPIQAPRSYRLVSSLESSVRAELGDELRALNLGLPGNANPRVRAYGEQLRRESASAADFISRLLEVFEDPRFSYTLRPARVDPRNPMDDFLFVTREGYCEYYASAFALLARAGGVPARIVTGYLGGDFNPVGRYYMVMQANAHAWSEVWLEDQGWVRVDPTALAAPRGIGDAADAIRERATFGRHTFWSIPVFYEARLAWDALNAAWDRWVIGYSRSEQLDLLQWLGFVSPGTLAYISSLVAGMIIAVVVVALLSRWRPRRTDPDPLGRLYERYCRRLAGVGLKRRIWEGPRDYAGRVAAERPDLATAVNDITHLYVALRYGREEPVTRLPELALRIRRFRPRRRSRG